MSDGFFLNYREKSFKLTPAAYRSLTKNYLVNPGKLAKQVIDRFIDAGVDFNILHLYVSDDGRGNIVINFMTLG